MNNILLISLGLLLIGGQFGRIQVNNDIAFYLHDLLVVLYLTFNICSIKKLFSKVKIIINKQKILFLLLGLIILLAIIWSVASANFAITSLLYSARFLAYLLFMILLKAEYGERKTEQLLTWSGLGILLLGFVQYLFLPDLTKLYYLGFDDHFYRLTSTILDPAFTGMIFTLNLLFYLGRKKINKQRIVLIVLFLLGLALTYSRASYLSFSLAAAFLVWKNKFHFNKKIAMISILVLALSLPLLPKKSGGEGVKLNRTSTTDARLINAQYFLVKNQGMTAIFGLGPFNPHYEANEEKLIDHSHFADNLFVFCYNSFGIFGSLIIMILLLRELKNRVNQADYWQLALILALVSHSMFNSNISQSFVMLFFWGFYL